MNAVLTVARKELRTYFQSPVALLFLGVFLVATLLWFFSGARFFARNLADVRPLFEALPALLVFLVSAITMRQWAEEQKAEFLAGNEGVAELEAQLERGIELGVGGVPCFVFANGFMLPGVSFKR